MNAAPEGLEAYADRLRDELGASEAEAYAAVNDDGLFALVEVWPSQAQYAEHWASAVANPKEDWLLGQLHDAANDMSPSEFYMVEPFGPGAAWTATAIGAQKSAIVWPGRGAVRVVLQIGLTDSAQLRANLVADQMLTRREPGCLQYQWLRSVDVAEHFLLLELWENQFVYDKHWSLRTKTGSAGGEMPMVERKRGTGGIEFYRQQEFTHLYDRWLPADVRSWSETVVWGS
ncbi:hypothetical protein JCM18899A_54840 [Nocardioides sp. AN3]